MPILQRLVVALDGSQTAERAFSLALELSREYGGELLLCTALDRAREMSAASMPDIGYPSAALVLARFDEAASTLLQAFASRAQAAGARASTLVLEGRPAAALVACARERGADAIVLGTHGRDALERAFLGSTAQGVLRLADIPTFVVSHRDDHDGATAALPAANIARILVAVDDSDPADGAIAFARSLAAGRDNALMFCSVIETGQLIDNSQIYGCDPAPFLREARHAALALLETKLGSQADPGGAVERVVLEGNTADTLLEAAVERRADLIVCGTHGRRGVRRLFIGSVAESLVRRSSVPVAVIRKTG